MGGWWGGSGQHPLPILPVGVRLLHMSRKAKALKEEFEFVGEGGIDERKRLSLAKALGTLKERLGELGAPLEDLHFRVYVNSDGQVLLDPALTVPVREMWLYRNPVALGKFARGWPRRRK